MPPIDNGGLTGLSLSGGGIRSASFCLGVLQGLDSLTDHHEPHLLDAIDYLSTVSGGGYVGTSLSLGLMRGDHSFPFDSRLDQNETPETQHLRNYANFLVPNGAIDYFISAAIVLRGLLVNAILVTPALLILSALTIFGDPFVADPLTPVADASNLHGGLVPHGSFFFAGLVASAVAVALLASALYISFTYERSTLRKRERLGKGFGVGLVALLLVAACEVQPFLVHRFYLTYSPAEFGFTTFGTLLPKVGAAIAAASAALVPMAQKLANIVKAQAGDASWSAWTRKALGWSALAVAGVAVPALLWIEYVYLTFWALRPDAGHLNPYLPNWLNWASRLVFSPLPHVERLGQVGTGYIGAALVLGALALLFGPNANSLHRLYRDRLSRAFIFDRPECKSTGKVENFKFSQLKPSAPDTTASLTPEDAAAAPFLLVNAAVNLDGSRALKARGRRADVFTFSPLHAGSESTDYVRIEAMEDVVSDLGLTTAMAISGAAASANMGAHTLKVLTFSLSLLNIRLGYWLPNPKRLKDFGDRFRHWIAGKDRLKSLAAQCKRRLANVGAFYFLLESFGLLDDKRLNVYLTDGGHIENLGVYALLKRRCKVIVAVDAECDPGMTFPALVNLEVIARIDMGIRIELPWQALQASALAITPKTPYGASGSPGTPGPHGAIGRIIYREGEEGILIYIKSSLSGDENDYVLDYKRRNSAFPHETTVDQFFTEEQFEAYRALGFHIARSLLSGSDHFCTLRPAPPGWQTRVREALLWLNVPPAMADVVANRA